MLVSFMEMGKMIEVYLEYCVSKQLRPKTIGSYRQALELFAVWLKESEGIEQIEDVRDATIRRYIMNLQQRGKYTAVCDDASLLSNYPDRRKDFGGRSATVYGAFSGLQELDRAEKLIFVLNGPFCKKRSVFLQKKRPCSAKIRSKAALFKYRVSFCVCFRK